MKKLRDYINTHPAFSLQVRLTLYFIFFGVLIGYITFVVTRTLSTTHFFEIAHRTIVPILGEISHSKKKDLISGITGRKNKQLGEMLSILDKVFTSELGKTEFQLFYNGRNSEKWKRLTYDRNYYFNGINTSSETSRQLDLAYNTNLISHSKLCYGASDTLSFMIKIPIPDSSNRYIVKLDLNRQGILTVIRRNIHRFLLASLMLLVISIILGKVFARRISEPIKRLSEAASERAMGNLDIDFTINRSDEIGTLSRSLNIMTGRIDMHVKEIERRMNAMETMNKIDKEVLSSISREDLLDRVIAIVSSLFKNSSVSMALYSSEKKGFELLSYYNNTVKGILSERPFIPVNDFNDNIPDKLKGLLQVNHNSGDISLLTFFERITGSRTGFVINAPVYMDNKYMGSVILSKESNSEYPPDKIEAIRMLADQVGVALQSIISFEERENLLIGIMVALTRSIDAKSKWTAGHSERVARYAEKLAIFIGMDDEEINNLTFSAILHDIGKIGVPEIILDKPGKLSDEEFSIIKEHPGKGAGIIADIPSYRKILPGILYHHERWDGGGYPEGLKGDEIPVISRIIAIADVYDAITSDRPYRKGMGTHDALDFMKSNRNIMFDSNLVNKFLESLNN